MSQQFIRKAQPDCIYQFLKVSHKHRSESGSIPGSCTLEELINSLVDNAAYEPSKAAQTVSDALNDGLLVTVPTPEHSPRGPLRNRAREKNLLCLPSKNEITHSTYDCYCFECHLPGMLEHCHSCPRSFHRACFRKNADRPNYRLPSAKLQKNAVPIFSSDTDSSSSGDDVEQENASVMHGFEGELRASSSLLLGDQTSLSSQRSPEVITENVMGTFSDLEYESKTKCEVVCLGVVREPTRKRPGTTISTISYKSEELSTNDEEQDTELCTRCRLLKIADLRNPPNVETDELCHLINFTFERNRSWITKDIPSHLDSMKLTPNEIEIVEELLFKIHPLSLDDISEKIKKLEYKYLMEFLGDILDLQHRYGIFFGSSTTETESTKWLVRYIKHDLAEIRRCSDCYRYSHDKVSRLWFAKPCVQRHELVFAKHSGFSYWPAKVIRVLPNNKYDVRFFGSFHSRALVDVRFIRPLDTDVKSLKLGSTSAIKKAMEEMRYHQILSAYPPSKFSFHANKKETEEILQNALLHSGSDSVIASGRKRGRKRKHVSDSAEQHSVPTNLTLEQSSIDNNISYEKVIRNNSDVQNASASSSRRSNSQRRRIRNRPLIYEEIQNELDVINENTELHHTQREEKLLAKVKELQDVLRKKDIEVKSIKRKQWCYWCLKEARYLCCFKATYCSKLCQMRHWKSGHEAECKNEQSGPRPAKAPAAT